MKKTISIIYFLLFVLSAFNQDITLTTPIHGTQYNAPATLQLSAEASGVLYPSPAYMHVTNTLSGFRKLKFGNNANSVYSPSVNVIQGGNTHVIITLRNFGGTIDWSSILFKPMGSGNLSIASYVEAIGGVGDEWKTIQIPLADFGPGVDFTQVANLEFPYSADAGTFDLGISEIRFVGGSAPYLWFGDSKTDNKHNGNGGPGELVATVVAAQYPTLYASKAEFYSNGIKVGEDLYPPYSFTWRYVPAGSYGIQSVLVVSDGSTYASGTSNVEVVQNIPTGSIAVELSQPQNGAVYQAPVDVKLAAQVSGVPAPESDYLLVSNTLSGFRKLKLGYNSVNIYSPGNDVLAGGNNKLEITLRDQNGGGTNWADIKLKPNSSGNLGLLPYVTAAGGVGADWVTITIPLSAFDPSIDFSQLAYMELPYSADAGSFAMAISSIRFTGGSSPFVWFGEGKTNNKHNGNGGPGELVAALVAATNTGDWVSKVEFYQGSTKLGEDLDYPYEFAMAGLPQGQYSVKSKAYSNLGLEDESPEVSFTVNAPAIQPSPLGIQITSPLANTMYYAPVDFMVTAEVSGEVEAGPDYLKVINNQTGFRKLKLGYSPTNLYGSPQNVQAGGNDTLLIILKDVAGNADFSLIQIRPSGEGTLALNSYVSNATILENGWIALRIPLSHFVPSIDFSQLSMFEFPYSAYANNFELAVSQMKFVGGNTPFVWFGDGKLDNYHDGLNGPGQLLANVVLGTTGEVFAAKVEFYDGTLKLGEDTDAPFSLSLNNVTSGLHKLNARLTDNNGLIKVSDTNSVLVQEVLPPSALILNVTFAKTPLFFDIQKAPLRYNKDFAYSLTLDDGLQDAYTCGFPLLNGGFLAANNTTYPGLFYTDGCGNDVKFKAGLSWYSKGSAMNDLHINSTNYLNWPELETMLNAGWNVFNHSLQHASGIGTDYEFQITENTNYIRSKVGVTTTQFIIPSGDTGYVQPAFSNGMSVVYANNGDFMGYPNGLDVSTSLNYQNLKVFRRFLYDDFYNPSNITQHIDNAAGLSSNGSHIWYNDFTHRVGLQSYGGSLLFSTFEYYMNYVANTYGKNGTDRVWMAPLQEVYEYLLVRDLSVVSTNLTGTNLEIVIDRTALPDSLLSYALSFVIKSDADILSVVANQPVNLTFKGHPFYSGSNPPPPPEAHMDISTKLINLQWESNTLKSSGAIEKPEEIEAGRKESLASAMQISPNPVSNHLNIAFDEISTGFLEVFNSSGLLVYQTVISAKSSAFVDVSNWKSGLYFVCLKYSDGRASVTRFVKK